MFRVEQIDLGRMRPSGHDRRVVLGLMIRGQMMGNSSRGVLEVVWDMIPDSKRLSTRHSDILTGTECRPAPSHPLMYASAAILVEKVLKTGFGWSC